MSAYGLGWANPGCVAEDLIHNVVIISVYYELSCVLGLIRIGSIGDVVGIVVLDGKDGVDPAEYGVPELNSADEGSYFWPSNYPALGGPLSPDLAAALPVFEASSICCFSGHVVALYADDQL